MPLSATSALRQQPGHSICHVIGFHYLDDGRDQFKNDFKKSRTDLGAKSVYGPNREITQNVGTKSVFTPILNDLFI